MAMTAALSASLGLSASEPMRARRVRFTFDTDYAAGGYAVDWDAITGMEDVGASPAAPYGVLSEAISDQRFLAQYDRTNTKIKVYDLNTDAEVADGLNALTDVTWDAIVLYH